MHASERQIGLTERLVDALHVEALVLADESRAYFDDSGRGERNRLAPIDRVLFSCESLKVTTRLMHIVAWLLSRRGPIDPQAKPPRPLGASVESDPDALVALPVIARQLIAASRDLHARVQRLETEIGRSDTATSPARALLGRLERAL